MTRESGPHEAQSSSAGPDRSTSLSSSAPLWHEILERLREVQESQAKLADAIEVLGLMVQDAMGSKDESSLGFPDDADAPAPRDAAAPDLPEVPEATTTPMTPRAPMTPWTPIGPWRRGAGTSIRGDAGPRRRRGGRRNSGIQGLGRTCRQFHQERRGLGAAGMERSSAGARTSRWNRRTRTGLLRPFLRRGGPSRHIGRGALDQRSRCRADVGVRPRTRRRTQRVVPQPCGDPSWLHRVSLWRRPHADTRRATRARPRYAPVNAGPSRVPPTAEHNKVLDILLGTPRPPTKRNRTSTVGRRPAPPRRTPPRPLPRRAEPPIDDRDGAAPASPAALRRPQNRYRLHHRCSSPTTHRWRLPTPPPPPPRPAASGCLRRRCPPPRSPPPRRLRARRCTGSSGCCRATSAAFPWAMGPSPHSVRLRADLAAHTATPTTGGLRTPRKRKRPALGRSTTTRPRRSSPPTRPRMTPPRRWPPRSSPPRPTSPPSGSPRSPSPRSSART